MTTNNKNIFLKEFVDALVKEELNIPQPEHDNNECSELFEGVFSWIKKALSRRKGKGKGKEREEYLKTSQGKNQEIARAAKNLSFALSRLEYENEVDRDIFSEFIWPLLKRIEAIYGEQHGFMEEQQEPPEKGIVGGPEPMRIGSAYLEKEAIMKRVQEVILDKAPQGTQSQGQYLDILSQACDQVNNELSAEAGDNVDKGSDLELTLGMVERVLMNIPHEVFFQALEHRQ